MKENVLDVLMYLFENYIDEDELGNPNRDELKLELQEAGFATGEVEKAFRWLDGLAELAADGNDFRPQRSDAIRVYSSKELEKMDPACCGFLLFLEQIGVLDAQTRELVIDRIMALETDQIDEDQVKWVVLMVLFNQPGQEAAFAWVEDLVFEEHSGFLH